MVSRLVVDVDRTDYEMIEKVFKDNGWITFVLLSFSICSPVHFKRSFIYKRYSLFCDLRGRSPWLPAR